MAARYAVRFDRRASKELAKLPKTVRTRIAKALATLTHTPRPAGAVKLKDSDLYRARIGDYRIIYTIKDEALVVILLRIGHRKNVYKDVERLSTRKSPGSADG